MREAVGESKELFFPPFRIVSFFFCRFASGRCLPLSGSATLIRPSLFRMREDSFRDGESAAVPMRINLGAVRRARVGVGVEPRGDRLDEYKRAKQGGGERGANNTLSV